MDKDDNRRGETGWIVVEGRGLTKDYELRRAFSNLIGRDHKLTIDEWEENFQSFKALHAAHTAKEMLRKYTRQDLVEMFGKPATCAPTPTPTPAPSPAPSTTPIVSRDLSFPNVTAMNKPSVDGKDKGTSEEDIDAESSSSPARSGIAGALQDMLYNQKAFKRNYQYSFGEASTEHINRSTYAGSENSETHTPAAPPSSPVWPKNRFNGMAPS
jgi:hypothetical protein